jgi:Nitrile hydratase, alpha chain
MSEEALPSRRDLEDRLVARAWADEAFRERLKADPRSAVAEEVGITLPESIEIEVLEETPQKGYLVIPANRVVISDELLEAASGGELYGPEWWGGTCGG